jgi:hypothetical protein
MWYILIKMSVKCCYRKVIRGTHPLTPSHSPLGRGPRFKSIPRTSRSSVSRSTSSRTTQKKEGRFFPAFLLDFFPLKNTKQKIKSLAQCIPILLTFAYKIVSAGYTVVNDNCYTTFGIGLVMLTN